MAYRNITKITLYPIGLVCCEDAQGFQAPPLQGMFNEVIDNLKEHFAPDDITWIYGGQGTEFKEISFEEWEKIGSSINLIDLEEKPLDLSEINPNTIGFEDPSEG